MRAKVLNIKLFALNKPSAILKVKYFKIPHYAYTNRQTVQKPSRPV